MTSENLTQKRRSKIFVPVRKKRPVNRHETRPGVPRVAVAGVFVGGGDRSGVYQGNEKIF
eukprot:31079-Pelagococcus_subviridis.AAC.2